MADTNKLPSVFSLSNIKTALPLTLDRETAQYPQWASLFKVQATIHNVLHHIIPPTDDEEKAAIEKMKKEDPLLWKRLDAAVRQWIYATVTPDILNTILRDDDTAAVTWRRVEGMFNDNRTSRALYLQNELSNCKLANFPDTNAYCNHLKNLSDRLANVGAAVPDDDLVLRMLDGLSDSYSSFKTFMRMKKKLPLFEDVRTKIALEETILIEKAKQEASNTALAASANSGNTAPANGSNFSRGAPGGNRGNYGKKNYNNFGHYGYDNGRYTGYDERNSGYGDTGNYSGGYYNGGNRGRGYGGRSRGRGSGGGRGRHFNQGAPFNPQQWWGYSQPQYAFPPCPYPTQEWSRPPTPQQGILGVRPPTQQQAHIAEMNPPTMTDINAAMHTATLAPPNWLMDTGATSHMTSASDWNAPHEM